MNAELAPPLQPASERDREWALGLYLALAALFIASLVTCNLIFRKFFFWTLPGMEYTFEASVGLLAYPLTFLVTDLISEVFGKKRADDVVKGGLVASVFTLGIITLAGGASATEWSPVSDGEFDHVFGQTLLAVGASMAAYLIAQFLDVRIFHFWKHRTGGRKLWLRNNFSTIPSQFVDTVVVLVLLCSVGEIEWGLFGALLINGFGFKVLVAALDTPLVYLGSGLIRRRFGLSPGQEIAL
ncbi:MAG: queuosine precursor transporter [Flavobacteriales bacterium]|nr:queuosine precursor transporter [Flavobacteriales bacterium]